MTSNVVNATKQKGLLGRLLFYGIMGGCGCVLFAVATLNIQPYRMALMKGLGSMAPGILTWPSVRVFCFLFGTIIFLGIQACEILPGLIQQSRAAVLTILDDIENQPDKVESKDDDSPLVKRLKEKLNNVPERLIKLLFRLKSWVYAVDGVICWIVFPPVKAGVTIGTFNVFRDLAWGNVLLIALTLFACEAVCWVIGIVYGSRRWIETIGVK